MRIAPATHHAAGREGMKISLPEGFAGRPCQVDRVTGERSGGFERARRTCLTVVTHRREEASQGQDWRRPMPKPRPISPDLSIGSDAAVRFGRAARQLHPRQQTPPRPSSRRTQADPGDLSLPPGIVTLPGRTLLGSRGKKFHRISREIAKPSGKRGHFARRACLVVRNLPVRGASYSAAARRPDCGAFHEQRRRYILLSAARFGHPYD
jgi:hypothetical protein